ncbi:SIP domain-containing protein [Streptomyces albidus (ex Kaewkla and Franco 2022)]|uniref:SIP domain-containing protein n=1 Tax=Streptomyces albidus (ex Kaewkla and Franco 2022) TaxID=722709 RepID=UPI0015EF745F|nr:SIP domain-containing protein [Streptomyces albidus (ex Kaewkla and Franco 2022)]
MARVPKVLAEYAQRRGFTTKVTSVERPSPSLLRVTFHSPALRARSISPCDVTAFRVCDNDFRHYTTESHDPDAGTATVLFHDHGRTDAPGLALIESLVPGSDIVWCGLDSARSFRWTSPRTTLAMGDASTLGLMAALTERANAEGARLLVAVEIEPSDCDYVRTLLPDAVVLAASDEHGAALDEWLVDADGQIRTLAPQTVHLAGHGGSIQRQRDALRTRHGLDRRAIRTQPYWATGRTGL